MKRIWISLALLAVMLAGALGNSFYLTSLTDRWVGVLQQGQYAAMEGNIAAGTEALDQVTKQWKQREGYLYIVLRHDETDSIAVQLQQVRQLLIKEEWGEYAAANAALTEQIRLLAEMERFNLKNLL